MAKAKNKTIVISHSAIRQAEHKFTPERDPASFWEKHPDWLRIREDKPRLECSACKAPIYTDREGYTHKGTARLQRGSFALADESGEYTTHPTDEENIKAELIICADCWFTDPELCAFFNKIGWRTR